MWSSLSFISSFSKYIHIRKATVWTQSEKTWLSLLFSPKKERYGQLFVTVQAVAINMHNISAKLAPSLFSNLTNLGPNLQERGARVIQCIDFSFKAWNMSYLKTESRWKFRFFVMRYGGISNNRSEKIGHFQLLVESQLTEEAYILVNGTGIINILVSQNRQYLFR